MQSDLPPYLTSTEEFKEEFDAQLEEISLKQYVEIVINEDKEMLSLDQIVSSEKGCGYANKALILLLSLCDYYQKDIKLIARALDEDTDTVRLVGWYERNGFVKEDAAVNELIRRHR